ncbi:hypothetical protein N7466_009448 [Penicillium verhagenii]|uniref:uncharacterized protein n=1 Tax=Penicillium verhagenii TaxID=1562060 RepID=UPI00254581A4|nr:uncharacterized protein N7466_009448 [Penicillium verhagenii]KAJ5921122.1 hypothetical protein N7466_009448 [Penicillium verhagenii]
MQYIIVFILSTLTFLSSNAAAAPTAFSTTTSNQDGFVEHSAVERSLVQRDDPIRVDDLLTDVPVLGSLLDDVLHGTS